MTCPEITMDDRTYQVCALTMFALRQNFRVVVLEHKLDMSISGNYFQKLRFIRLGYNSIKIMYYGVCTSIQNISTNNHGWSLL